ncbi:MAG TPA: aldo/keto reductase [Candidatus Limnocylindria bacterium]|nr:aldo/keto reductase [Candidatus Limnocylindria bacterium]
MEYVKLGDSGIEVSRVCAGCMSFGASQALGAWTLGQEETIEVVRRALDAGITFFDTANVYSGGLSEEYLGRAVRDLVPRDQVVIASKVYNNEGKLSRAAIQREIEGSLRRLGMDYLDLYIIHRYDYTTPVEETLEALHGLVISGKVRALGASAMYAYQFHTMQIIARDNGWTPFVSMQNHWNLLYREDEREMVPLCRQMNVALTPYSPLAAGRLSRPDWEADTPRFRQDQFAVGKYDGTREQDIPIAQRVRETADRLGVTMSQVALAWLFQKGADSPIVGATRAEYLEEAAGALSIRLTPEDVAFLEEPYLPHKVVGALLP